VPVIDHGFQFLRGPFHGLGHLGYANMQQITGQNHYRSVANAIYATIDLDTHIYPVTNAAGGLNPDYSVGDIVLLNDHLNLAGLVGIHPLRGPNEDDFGVRFPPLSDAYDLDLRRRTHRAWKTLGLHKGTCRLHEGVYAFVGGPSYETRAECRMLRMLGGDVVGMSTAPEIVTARHSGIRVLAFSLVTNKSVLEAGPRGDDLASQNFTQVELTEYLSSGRANHEEVLKVGQDAAVIMQVLMCIHKTLGEEVAHISLGSREADCARAWKPINFEVFREYSTANISAQPSNGDRDISISLMDPSLARRCREASTVLKFPRPKQCVSRGYE